MCALCLSVPSVGGEKIVKIFIFCPVRFGGSRRRRRRVCVVFPSVQIYVYAVRSQLLSFNAAAAKMVDFCTQNFKLKNNRAHDLSRLHKRLKFETAGGGDDLWRLNKFAKLGFGLNV